MEEKSKAKYLIDKSDSFILVANEGLAIHVKDKILLMSLITGLLNQLYDSEVVTKEDLEYMLKLTTMSDDELVKEALKDKGNFMEFLKDLLEK